MIDQAAKVLLANEPWSRAFSIQQKTVQNFHRACSEVLADGCQLLPLAADHLSLHRNLFSTLFIMSLEASGVSFEQLPFYSMVNQCLRIQVTGCDNLLDDEYKSAIPFDLDGSGIRFRSVLTIMTGDAVLAGLIAAEVAAGRFDEEMGRRLLAAVLGVLIPSGIEEHEEESAQSAPIPEVQVVLEQVHYRKTGLLFEAPVRLVEKMGVADLGRSGPVARALSCFGIGCQILDDLKDVVDDLYFHKHNLVISEACYGSNENERQLVQECRQKKMTREAVARITEQLPEARNRSLVWAGDYFQQARRSFANCFPAFGVPQTEALGLLVQDSIMADRNDRVAGGLL